ncbi:MAG: hypothetical protein QIT36_gp046 [Methanophagales virus GBV301]|uniref:Uncharacterized protein n=1 Tax=Methanophagales virus GBV301 TaxID=2999280 RepID=A0A9E8V8C7_9CAUD|nr:MAG: hypothetical protein QIT36_gp046 [Methanophagales virus GBV301]WAE39470.1 MAG: hypothetical protein LDLAKGPJ_00046 [Methanophagales virus GBV301]
MSGIPLHPTSWGFRKSVLDLIVISHEMHIDEAHANFILKVVKTIRRYRNFVISQICANRRKVYNDRGYRIDKEWSKNWNGNI